jgi:iron(III) transport system ATP-binding protein
VEVLDAAVDGTCAVRLFDVTVRMRCARDQRAGQPAQACLRARDLRIVAADAPGVRVQVERAVYQGGHFRLETRVAAAPQCRLHLTAPEPFAVPSDNVLNLAVSDGWVPPAAAR